MKAYILNIILSLIISLIAERFFKKGHRRLGIIALIVIVIISSLIAGARSEDVGYDIRNYVKTLFNDFAFSGKSIVQNYKKFGIEPGFTILVYLFSLTKNMGVVLFGIQLACITPVILYAYKTRERNSITLIVLIYLTIMYCFSLNIMRQSIAITLGLLVFHEFRNQKTKIGLILILIAFLFHRTSIILVIFYFINKMLKSSARDSRLKLFLLIISCIIIAIAAPYIISILPSKYSGYLGDERFDSPVNILSIIKKVFWIIPVLLCISMSKKNSEDKELLVTSFIYMILDIIIYLIGSKIPTVSRLSLYFSYIAYFISIPIIVTYIKPKILSMIIFSIVLLIFWIHMVLTDTSAHIYPYKSETWSILNE